MSVFPKDLIIDGTVKHLFASHDIYSRSIQNLPASTLRDERITRAVAYFMCSYGIISPAASIPYSIVES